jgi:hypothetical protein
VNPINDARGLIAEIEMLVSEARKSAAVAQLRKIVAAVKAFDVSEHGAEAIALKDEVLAKIEALLPRATTRKTTK